MIKYRAVCDCGFQNTYRHAGQAAYRLRTHSCQRYQDRAVQAAERLARQALVDRTPKPCLHKRADHRHGTRACYVLDRCRCLPCAAANVTVENQRNRLKAYGRYQGYVDAEPARTHLKQLVADGMGPKQIAKTSGIPHGTLSALLYGKHLGSGRIRWQKRIHQRTAGRILAVAFDPADPVIAPDAQVTIAWLRLRALVALGWSMSELGRRLGMPHPGNACRLITGDALMQWGTVRRIDNLYAELSMALPAATNQRQRISVARAKRYARMRRWQPPLGLPDTEPDADTTGIDISPAAAGATVDEQAIWRRLHGDKTVRLTFAEQDECWVRWRRRGGGYNEFEQLTGLSADRANRRLADTGGAGREVA